MSLLATLGPQLASNFLGHVFGANNRSVQGDCMDISVTGSYAAQLAKYPQCAPYLAGLVGGSSPVAPTIPLTPSPVPQSISYETGVTPAMATIPRLAAPVLKALPGVGTAVAGAASTALRVASTAGTRLQRLLAKYPSAAGIAGGFLIDAAGNYILSASGKRVSAKHRHINPLNVHALRRSIRRVKAARHICSQVDKIAGHHRRRAPSRGCHTKCR